MDRDQECRYCGKIIHGLGCPYSPDGYHEEIGDTEHCIRCGSTSYGPGCFYADAKTNPNMVHIHGHGKDSNGKMRCIYCGVILSKGSNMTGCVYSPNGKHKL